jgi:ABC-type multidrug transport system ATPase subunit
VAKKTASYLMSSPRPLLIVNSVTFATQLLTDSQVLLLDEPTSGLDGFTAHGIMKLLTELAAEGRTVILTVHRNRSDIFAANFIFWLEAGMLGTPVQDHRCSHTFEAVDTTATSKQILATLFLT